MYNTFLEDIYKMLANFYGVEIKIDSDAVLLINGDRLETSGDAKAILESFKNLLEKHATKNKDSIKNMSLDAASAGMYDAMLAKTRKQ